MTDNTEQDKSFKNRQRLQWQCRRGMLELELFLQDFLTYDYDALSGIRNVNLSSY